jgi:hypothetical protein
MEVAEEGEGSAEKDKTARKRPKRPVEVRFFGKIRRFLTICATCIGIENFDLNLCTVHKNERAMEESKKKAGNHQKVRCIY